MFSKRLFGIFVLLFLLAGCQTKQDEAVSLPIEIPSKPEVWTVQITDAAASVVEVLPFCEDAIPGVSILLTDSPVVTEPNPDFVIGSEFSSQGETNEIVLSETTLVVIKHPDNPFDSLSFQDLQNIYAGEVTNWNDLNIASSYAGEVQVISYIENSDLSMMIEQSLGEVILGQYLIVSDPEAVVKAVSEDINAIGIVPVRALNSTVKELSVADAELSYHVIVSGQNQSTEGLNWLRCLVEKAELLP